MSIDAALQAALEPVVSRLEAVAAQVERATASKVGEEASGVPSGRAAFTVREVAELLQVAPETVREWFASGRLVGLRTGNRILVWRWSLLELLGARPTP